MRTIASDLITKKVEEMCVRANTVLGDDVIAALMDAKRNEESQTGKDILNQLLLNAKIASDDGVPICQDTGLAVFFVTIGNEVCVQGDDIELAINKGVRKGYENGFLRKSVVDDPILRQNTKDNTPAVIYYEFESGDRLKIDFIPKGFGSENMSRVKMLKPSEGIEGIKDFVINTVKEAGANACPPLVVGIGIGGTMDKACVLSKKSLMRRISDKNSTKHLARLEDELLDEINKLGIGPSGFGGTTTALGVNILAYPTHIAGMPVAVNLSCHAARHESIVI